MHQFHAEEHNLRFGMLQNQSTSMLHGESLKNLHLDGLEMEVRLMMEGQHW
jgi:hypothetical protein